LRKMIIIVFIGLFMIGGLASSASAAVKVIVEGSYDEYPRYLSLKMEPITENGKILVPLRQIAETLGFEVGWNQADLGITIRGNYKDINMNIANHVVLVNEVPYTIDIAPRLVSNTTFVLLEFLCESLGYFVEYSSMYSADMQHIFITPYQLISDSELAKFDRNNFNLIPDDGIVEGFTKMKLKKGGMTPGGIQISSSIKDVLQVYGVPRSPERSLNYPADWSGKLEYWGTFVPQSDIGTFLEFTFDQGALTDLTVCV
jgi:hypothetical protein